jgi:hypothetical protein
MVVLFTRHAKARMIKRGISYEKVISAINSPDHIFKRNFKLFFLKRIDKKSIEVCCQKDKNLKVITVYWV